MTDQQPVVVEQAAGKAFDKHGLEIMLGDIVKVYHFTDRRRKRHFMYKQVTGERFWPSGFNCWFLSHLALKEDDGFYLDRNGVVNGDYEIVQSIDALLEDRPRTAIRSGKEPA